MNKRVVVTRKFFEEQITQKMKNYDLFFWDKASSPTQSDILEFSKGAYGLITMLSDPISKDLIEGLDDTVKIISNYAVGFNNIDVPQATKRGIQVTNTPEVLTDAVAELVVGMMISLGRGFESCIKEVRGEKFKGWEPDGYLGFQIKGKRVGIIGAGRIGRAIGDRLGSFGCDIVYTSRSRKSDLSMVELNELVSSSDFIVLSCALNDDTHHLIDKSKISLMKSSAFLINIGRGALVDEFELIKALSAYKIKGAALDVYEREPFVPKELRELPNVLLLPHIGSATYKTRRDMLDLAMDNIMAVAEGKNAITPVN